jgi:succinate-semialdehyde dehydrogenase / glutarate-semialdehyde dehydrogenase
MSLARCYARFLGYREPMTTITAPEEQRVLEQVPKQLFIGGRWRDGSKGTLSVEDPATAEALCEVADASADDATQALDAAVQAGPEWANHPPRERGEILRRAFEAIVDQADDLALLMTMEMGKPLKESKAEISYGAEFFRWFAEQAVRIDGRYAVAPNGQGRLLTMKQPVGPCLLITPWNFPLAMGTRKIGPAIAAGCTMVVKPAQQTPLSMLMLAKILEDAGLPPGVLNLITASSAGESTGPLIKDSRLRKLSFTGSTEVGRKLMEQASENLLRLSMELGGNAPFLVFEDADVDAAVEGAMIAKMRNIGEACTAANRFHVADSVADQFAEKLAEKMGAMTVGRGTEDDVEVGPLIDQNQREKVEGLVEDAVGRGARVLVGGHARDGAGYFFDPTVLSDIPEDAELLSEEIFGPVAPVKGFTDEDEAIAAANDTEYGLVAYVYTSDLKRALRVVERLETGMVGLNQGMVSNPAAPFGGIKQSGFGREGGPEGIEEYLETKYVAVNL